MRDIISGVEGRKEGGGGGGGHEPQRSSSVFAPFFFGFVAGSVLCRDVYDSRKMFGPLAFKTR